MAILQNQVHFILIPLMSPGHMNPMIDIAKALAQRDVTVTIITTPHNASRFKTIIARALEAGLQMQVSEVQFPCGAAGLPEGCENLDLLPDLTSAREFLIGTSMLQEPVEEVVNELKPPPSCMISDMCLPWTAGVAQKFCIPRLVFHGTCCFALSCMHNLHYSDLLDTISCDSEPFVLPGLPDRIEMTKAQVTPAVQRSGIGGLIYEAEKEAYGIVVNTFEELEPDYVKACRELKGKNVWCIGPVSLFNIDNLDKAERGNKACIDQHVCLKWLDCQEPGSVVYVCLGSLSRQSNSQMMELGLGLEASTRPFIWVARNNPDKFEDWLLRENFEERVQGRGLVIRGWAPQLLILSHLAIGGFITHCGWNSTIEGVCAGVPMITWPFFGEQFMNERLIVQVLGIGISIGVEVPVWSGEEQKDGPLVKWNDIKMAIEGLMDKGVGEERRERARELAKIAKNTVQEGGSSDLGMTLLIQDIMERGRETG